MLIIANYNTFTINNSYKDIGTFYFKISPKRAFTNFSYNTSLDMFQGILPPVDYPMSQAGAGKAAYAKAINNNLNVPIYYYGYFDLSNITPVTLHYMRKTTKRRLFYLSHWCKYTWRSKSYTLHLLWPIWLGRAPHGVLTQSLPSWNNPYRKNCKQNFECAEFAFINLFYLPPYENRWEQLDFTKSPLDNREAEEWLCKKFLPRVGLKPHNCWGFGIYRYTGGGLKDSQPSFIPPTVHLHEDSWKIEMDRYKKSMADVASKTDLVPEDYWWTEKEAAVIPFVRKWTLFGLGVPEVEPIVDSLGETHFPDGMVKDPEGENQGEYLTKMENPDTYFIRKEYPVRQYDPGAAYNLRVDLEGDSIVPRPVVLIDGKLRFRPRPRKWMDKSGKEYRQAMRRSHAYMFLRYQYAFGYRYDPADEDAEIDRIAEQIRREESPSPSSSDNESYSDEGGNYSVSWEKWGDPRSYRQFGGPEDDIADDILEDWATELRNERGDTEDDMDWESVAKGTWEGVLPAKAGQDATIDPWYQSWYKSFYFWEDPRHEE